MWNVILLGLTCCCCCNLKNNSHAKFTTVDEHSLLIEKTGNHLNRSYHEFNDASQNYCPSLNSHEPFLSLKNQYSILFV